MNSPKPLEPPPPGTGAVASLPTLGSLLGSIAGSLLAAKAKLDPVSAGSVVAGCTGLATALFHWIGSRIGIAL